MEPPIKNKILEEPWYGLSQEPLSGVLAEFILGPLEDFVFNNFSPKPCVSLRYVDVFIVWDNTNSLEDFVDKVDDIEKDITFTHK